MKTTFRSRIFRMAWDMCHNKGKSFAACLAESWKIYRLKKLFAKEDISFGSFLTSVEACLFQS